MIRFLLTVWEGQIDPNKFCLPIDQSCHLLQVRAGAEPRNLAVGDPEVVEVGPAMFSIPQVNCYFVNCNLKRGVTEALLTVLQQCLD